MKRLIGVGLLALGLLLQVAGCGESGGARTTMTVLAGSELKDLEPYLDQIARETGVALDFEYIGTLDGAERLTREDRHDLAWFSHGKYVVLTQESSGVRRIVAQEKIMLSPVVLGIRQSTARRLGWENNPDVTWADIATRAGRGEFTFMMTDASASNSGFSALFGILAAFSKDPNDPVGEGLDEERVKGFFKGNTARAGSSGWLAETYVREQSRFDGLVNYESVLLSLNKSGQLDEPLQLIYPREGIVTADYPLMLLKAEQREAYDRLVSYLKSDAFQSTIQSATFRRPVNRKVALDPMFRQDLLELPFPNSLDVINRALFRYLDQQRDPSAPVFVLDMSGSMQGESLQQLKQALVNLTGEDRSMAGQFARFREREQVTVVPFASTVQKHKVFAIHDASREGADMGALRQYVEGLRADGGTAIYDALTGAYQLLLNKPEEHGQYVTIVLMTDGENNEGIDLDAFLRYRSGLPEALQRIRIFPILFGNSSDEDMKTLASLTGGKVFDARKQSLSEVFKSIRGYQ